MFKLLLIVVITLIIWYWWSSFRRLPTQNRRSFLWRSAFWMFFCVLMILVYTGRMHWFAPALAALVPILKTVLAFGLRTLPFLKFFSRFKTTPSQFRTQSLVVEIYFSTKQIDGEVLTGDFTGKRLSELSAQQLQSLSDQFKGTDRESYILLQAYLLRSGNSTHQSDYQPGNYTDLTAVEAYKVLGLKTGDSVENIIKAHKRLMQRLHPDRGGSDYLAAKINSAKDKLT
jgi:hypothetical protein